MIRTTSFFLLAVASLFTLASCSKNDFVSGGTLTLTQNVAFATDLPLEGGEVSLASIDFEKVLNDYFQEHDLDPGKTTITQLTPVATSFRLTTPEPGTYVNFTWLKNAEVVHLPDDQNLEFPIGYLNPDELNTLSTFLNTSFIDLTKELEDAQTANFKVYPTLEEKLTVPLEVEVEIKLSISTRGGK